MGEAVVDKKYEEICKKLGFNPSEYNFVPSGYEDDSKESPFLALTQEERWYLYDKGYLNQSK